MIKGKHNDENYDNIVGPYGENKLIQSKVDENECDKKRIKSGEGDKHLKVNNAGKTDKSVDQQRNKNGSSRGYGTFPNLRSALKQSDDSSKKSVSWRSMLDETVGGQNDSFRLSESEQQEHVEEGSMEFFFSSSDGEDGGIPSLQGSSASPFGCEDEDCVWDRISPDGDEDLLGSATSLEYMNNRRILEIPIDEDGELCVDITGIEGLSVNDDPLDNARSSSDEEDDES